jgi:hypothetical protein
MTAGAETPGAVEKEALEIAKLKLEADKLKVETAKLHRERSIAPLTLAAQVFGSLCIIATGFIVLYFFQRPQLDQMDAARISNERLQLENYVISIQKFENDNDKVQAFEVLAAQWPQYPFLADLAHSAQTVVQTKRVAADCDASAVQIADLTSSIRTLETRIADGGNIKITGFNLGHINDPSLQAQKATLSAQVAIIQAKRKQDNCHGS